MAVKAHPVKGHEMGYYGYYSAAKQASAPKKAAKKSAPKKAAKKSAKK